MTNEKKQKKQDKMVSVYWTPAFVERLDAVAEYNSQRRNDYIKQAVKEKLERDEKRIATVNNIG